ncbi:MAG: hypothetical protein RJB03_160 [Bacteroidota bacterium]|jgi:hypothetical protein
MKKLLLAVVLILISFAFYPAPTEKWIPLFNGKNLRGWTAKIYHHETGDNYGNTFRAEEGMIKVRYDQYDHFNNRYGHLFYNKPYSYFKLRFDYRFTGIWRKDAPSYTEINSGVMYHSQSPASILKEQDWPISVEFQLLGGLSDGKARPTGNMCSPGTDVVFNGRIDPRHCISSSSKTYYGDQWVHAELIVLGDSLVTHIINGDTVLRYSKPQIGGGVANGFDPAIKIDGKLLKQGYIGLQSEGQEIDFKNIELLDLSKKQKHE